MKTMKNKNSTHAMRQDSMHPRCIQACAHKIFLNNIKICHKYSLPISVINVRGLHGNTSVQPKSFKKKVAQMWKKFRGNDPYKGFFSLQFEKNHRKTRFLDWVCQIYGTSPCRLSNNRRIFKSLYCPTCPVVKSGQILLLLVASVPTPQKCKRILLRQQQLWQYKLLYGKVLKMFEFVFRRPIKVACCRKNIDI